MYKIILLILCVCYILIGLSNAQSSCSRQISVTSGSTGTISSPNYPQRYPPNSRCTYVLIGASSSSHITLSFTSFRVEQHRNCAFDYLAVYDGASTSADLLGKFCGSSTPNPISSTGKYLTIYFHSDTSINGDGFQINYSVGCTYQYTNTIGVIKSPGYPSNYPDSSDCTYTVQPSQGSQILLSFTHFEVEESSGCDFDYLILSITGQSEAVGKYCGNKTPFKKLINASRLTLNFHSDRSVSRPGFFINYKMTTSCSDNNGGCSHNCTDLQPGKVLCTCLPGYTLDDNGVGCNDINECGSSPCDDACTNTEGSFSCSCTTEGYQLSPNGHTCTDMTCKTDNGGCEQLCQPFGNAQYHCACNPGFVLSDDAHNCTDMNECNTTNSNYMHQCEHKCVNEPGSYYCNCNEGYKVSANRRTCDDVDDCPTEGHVCSQRCVNIPGGWQCDCYEGYEIDPDDSRDCVDINECSEGLIPFACEHCLNFESSYSCTCTEGYEPNDDNTECYDVDECADGDNGGCEQLCLNKNGTFSCDCNSGYAPSTPQASTCDDINECIPNDGRGACDHYCENLPGTFECFCLGGYLLLEDKLSCKDINECDNDNGKCQQQCVNTQGSFHCECFNGYKDVNGTCIDVDECLTNPCDSSVQSGCSNTIGSFMCECPPGYTVTNVTVCADNDECASNKHGCAQLCHNSPGSYWCACEVGYTMNGDECVDINECSVDGTCQHQCYNMVGSYRCDCNDGYYLLGDGQKCSDLNECSEQLDDCEHICVNEIGYHRCECQDGYSLNDDNSTCADINECEGGASGCTHGCVNLPGSYFCFCDGGFELGADNRTCQDVDECATNNGGCQHICNNVNGSFSCGCRDGFSFNGTMGCMDIDECATSNGGCQHQCVNSDGAYECQCEPNYKLQNDSHACDHCPTCLEFQQVVSDVTMLKHLQATVELLNASNRRLNAAVANLEARITTLESGGNYDESESDQS